MITTVVGSYPRIPKDEPGKLIRAIDEFEKGKISKEKLSQIQDEITIEIMKEQIDAGIDLITDGQIRWDDDQTYFARKIGGFSINGLIRYFDTNTYYRQPVVEGELKWNGPIAVKDFEFASKNSSIPVKPIVTGPYTLAKLSKNNYYDGFEDMLFAIANVLAKEVHALEAAGAKFIQINEPAILKNKGNFHLLAEAIERITKGIKAKIALYSYFSDIDDIYPEILDLRVDVIGLDFVMGRKNFDLVKKSSFTKCLGFGIIDARNTKMEKIDDIVSYIKKIGQIVPLDKLYINPNCGLEFLPREIAHSKLVNMVRGVKKARRTVE